MSRRSEIRRETSETKIELTLDLDGRGRTDVKTGIGFFDHMLTLLGKHSGFDFEVVAVGDIEVDFHHTVEDVGLCLGKAILEALGDKAGICRYGDVRLPMDESLAMAAVDLSGRSYFHLSAGWTAETIGAFPVELVAEFWKSVASEARMSLHLDLVRSENVHHGAEAIFKAAARALRVACARDPAANGEVPSTKGTLSA